MSAMTVEERMAAFRFPSVLYHGTSAGAFERIQQSGAIWPRAKGTRNNWKHTVGSNAQCVYLTTCYALHFAVNAAQEEEELCVLELDTSRLDYANLQSDEDALEQVMRKHDELPEDWGIKRRTIWYRSRAHRYRAESSLITMGTCSHRGKIDAKAITRAVFVTPQAWVHFVMQAFDPMISIENYRFCGAQHNEFHRWLFGEPSHRFERLSRKGVRVVEVMKGETV